MIMGDVMRREWKDKKVNRRSRAYIVMIISEKQVI